MNPGEHTKLLRLGHISDWGSEPFVSLNQVCNRLRECTGAYYSKKAKMLTAIIPNSHSVNLGGSIVGRLRTSFINSLSQDRVCMAWRSGIVCLGPLVNINRLEACYVHVQETKVAVVLGDDWWD